MLPRREKGWKNTWAGGKRVRCPGGRVAGAGQPSGENKSGPRDAVLRRLRSEPVSEQVARIRNISVGDCLKTDSSKQAGEQRTSRNAQHHSADQLLAGAQPIRLALRAGRCQWEQRVGDTEGRGGDRKTATATPPLSPRSQECGPAPGRLSVGTEMDTSNADADRAGSQELAA